MATCKWCGVTFTKKHNREMYCSSDCRKYAKLEQNNNHARKERRYKKKYHIQTFQDYKNNLGTVPVSIDELRTYKQSF